MEDVDFWRLCDELTVYQAAHLLIGVMPGEVEAMEAMGSDLVPRDRARYTKNLAAAQAAIANGLKNYKKYCEACEEANRAMAAAHYEPGAYDEHDEHGLALMLRRSIVGELIPLYETDINGNQAWPMPGTIDCDKSTVDVDSFKRWLKSRGFITGFFFPEGSDDSPDYLDPRNPRYAPKLAAAVRAWQAVTNPGKKSPKQALDKWLREHAAEFGLTGDDGNPVNQAIEECSKIANWQPGGGAPKTPGA